MDSLTNIRENIETLMTNGGITEGAYLEMMNDLKKIFQVIPTPPPTTTAPAPGGVLNRDNIGIVLSGPPLLTDIDRIMATYFHLSPFYRTFTEYPPTIRLIDAMDKFLKGEFTVEDFTAAFLPTTHAEVSSCWDLIMAMAENKWLREEDFSRIRSIPCVRTHYLTKLMRTRSLLVNRLGMIWGGISEKSIQNLFENFRFDTKVFHFSTRKHYNKYVPCDKSKSHALELRFNTLGGYPVLFQCWTKCIQFGRTACVSDMNYISFLLCLWFHLSGALNFPEEMSARIIQHTKYHEDYLRNLYRDIISDRMRFLRLEVSGITARTREKNRTYSSPCVPGFSLTYCDAINSPKKD